MSEENSLTGVPDPDAEYFARIEFGRSAADGKEEKIYLSFQYPNLPYGGMVGIQKLLSETALPDLVTQGELVAEMMGQPVQSMEEVKTTLTNLRNQNKGKGRPG